MENPEERSSKFNKWVYDKVSFQIGGEKKGGGGDIGWLIQNAAQQKFIQHCGTIIVK